MFREERQVATRTARVCGRGRTVCFLCQKVRFTCRGINCDARRASRPGQSSPEGLGRGRRFERTARRVSRAGQDLVLARQRLGLALAQQETAQQQIESAQEQVATAQQHVAMALQTGNAEEVQEAKKEVREAKKEVQEAKKELQEAKKEVQEAKKEVQEESEAGRPGRFSDRLRRWSLRAQQIPRLRCRAQRIFLDFSWLHCWRTSHERMVAQTRIPSFVSMMAAGGPRCHGVHPGAGQGQAQGPRRRPGGTADQFCFSC